MKRFLAGMAAVAMALSLQAATLSKAQCVASTSPAEGPVNMTLYPGGVSYIQMVMTQIPEINRAATSPLTLTMQGQETPVATIDPANTQFFYVQTQGVVNDYENLVHLFFTDGIDITEPGQYTVTIPEGTFTFGESDTNGQIKLNYTVPVMLDYAIYPRPDVSLTSVSDFTLAFTRAARIEPGENRPVLTRLYPQKNFSPVSVTTDGKAAFIHFDTADLSGVFTLKLPAGAFKVTLDSETYPSQVMEFTFDATSIPAPKISPAQGLLSNPILDKIVLTLPDDAEVTSILEGNSYNRLMRCDAQGNIDYSATLAWYDAAEPVNEIGDNQVTLAPRSGQPVALSPGNYAFISAKYLYTIKGGDTAGEYKYFWTVADLQPSAPQPGLVVPTNGFFDSLQALTLQLPGSESLQYVSFYTVEGRPATAVGNSTDEPSFTMMAVPGYCDSEILLLPASDLSKLPSGKYTLSLPAALYISTAGLSRACELTLDYRGGVSGIKPTCPDTPQADSVSDFHTLEGVKVATGRISAILPTLPKGFYIAGGRKFIVK